MKRRFVLKLAMVLNGVGAALVLVGIVSLRRCRRSQTKTLM